MGLLNLSWRECVVARRVTEVPGCRRLTRKIRASRMRRCAYCGLESSQTAALRPFKSVFSTSSNGYALSKFSHKPRKRSGTLFQSV
jgi:hypothetical protein